MSSHPKLDALTSSPTVKVLSGTVRVLTFAAGLGALGGLYALGTAIGKLSERSDVTAVAIPQLVQGQKDLHVALTQEHEDAAKAAATAAQAAATAAAAAAQTAKDLAEGKAANLPRLERLEQVIPPIQSDLAAIKQHLTDIEAITRSHDSDIRATREAVAPRTIPGGH